MKYILTVTQEVMVDIDDELPNHKHKMEFKNIVKKLNDYYSSWSSTSWQKRKPKFLKAERKNFRFK